MSASREKKQRQSAGPDQKALRAQQAQAARRKKTIVYSIVGAVAAVLVIALLVWRTGFFQARATAATVGTEKLTTAQFGYHYNSVRNNFVQYGLIDTSRADDEQVYNAESGQTFRDYFMEIALKNAQSYYALAAEARSAGHTESEVQDDLATAISNAKSAAASSGLSYAAYLQAMYGPYMTTGVFEQELTRILMASLASGEKYGAFYDSYAQADLDAYYDGHADDLDTIEYSYLYFAAPTVNTKDADGNELPEDEVQKLKDDAKAEAKAKADEALAAVKGGASFQSQIDKYELSAASNSDHAKVVGTSSVGSAYREDLLKLGKGKCDMVEVDGGYYVIALHDRYLADEPTRDVRHILVLAENATEEHEDHTHEEAPTDEAWAAAKAKMDEIQAAWDASDKTEDAFAKLANEKSDDGGSNTNGGLYERSYDGRFVTEFNDWVFSSDRKNGDVGLVQHNEEGGSYYGYHLIYFVGENEPVWMDTARDALADTATTEWMEGLTANYPTAESSGANYFGK